MIARSQFHANGASFVVIGDLPLRVLVPLLFAEVNLFLGVFNFLPIPPLDGAALIERVLPSTWLPNWYRFRPFGILVLFVLVFSTMIPNGWNLYQFGSHVLGRTHSIRPRRAEGRDGQEIGRGRGRG